MTSRRHVLAGLAAAAAGVLTPVGSAVAHHRPTHAGGRADTSTTTIATTTSTTSVLAPPATPTGMVVEAGEGSARHYFLAVEGAEIYEVEVEAL